MIPTWMIEDLERLRQERHDRPQRYVELPLPPAEEVPAIPAPPWSIVVEFGDEAPVD